MPFVYFADGDYEYSNHVQNYTSGGTNVGVRIRSDRRETITSPSAIPSSVTYNGVTYTVKELTGYFPTDGRDYGSWDDTAPYSIWGCFEKCLELTTVPTFPASIDYTSVQRLFYDCAKLESAPSLPEGAVDLTSAYAGSGLIYGPSIPSSARFLTAAFSGCKSLKSIGSMPTVFSSTWNSITGMFSGCTSLIEAPPIPTNTNDMISVFSGCTSLTSAPEIPASISRMGDCFYNCPSLEGNIIVNNEVVYNPYYSDQGNPFGGSTKKNIFIINGAGTTAVETAWKKITALSSNVHYEADDNPRPALSNFSIARVAASGTTASAEKGTWAYITATMTIYSTLLPVGWTNELKSRVLTEDGTILTPTWFPSTLEEYPVDIWCWVNTEDTFGHYFTLQIYDAVKNENDIEKRSLQSPLLSFSFPKSYALVDYYHDSTTGTEGFAIGKFAESADLFDVGMETIIRDKAHLAGIITQIDEPYIGLDAWYGYSDEAAATAIKVVDTFSQDWKKTNGAYLVAIFEYATSVDTSLNVDGTGATAAYYNGSRLGANNGAWAAGDVVIFEYSSARYNRIDYSDSLPVDVRLTYHILSLGWGGDVFGPILVPVSPQTA